MINKLKEKERYIMELEDQNLLRARSLAARINRRMQSTLKGPRDNPLVHLRFEGIFRVEFCTLFDDRVHCIAERSPKGDIFNFYSLDYLPKVLKQRKVLHKSKGTSHEIWCSKDCPFQITYDSEKEILLFTYAVQIFNIEDRFPQLSLDRAKNKLNKHIYPF